MGSYSVQVDHEAVPALVESSPEGGRTVFFRDVRGWAQIVHGLMPEVLTWQPNIAPAAHPTPLISIARGGVETFDSVW
jgi:hypothetical protein